MSSNIPNKSDLATREDLLAAKLAIKEDFAQLGRDLHRAIWTVGFSIIGTILTGIGISTYIVIRFSA